MGKYVVNFKSYVIDADSQEQAIRKASEQNKEYLMFKVTDWETGQCSTVIDVKE